MFSILPATRDDAAVIADFQIRMARETEDLTLDPSTVEQGVAAIFNDPGKGRYYVAKEQEQVIGCLLTTPEWSEWKNATVLWIQSVYVDSAHRGKGVYRAMYRHIQQLVKSSDNLSGIRLYVDYRNKHAQKVYTSLGMDNEHYQLYEWMKN